MTAISAKVRTDEKALFEQLCETEGLTASKAIRSFIINYNEQSTISEPNDEQVLNDEHEAKLTLYMASHGIRKMNR
jgi:antitoxin component of RelBE/YafQ-DinJ toxin-antitoxin module